MAPMPPQQTAAQARAAGAGEGGAGAAALDMSALRARKDELHQRVQALLRQEQEEEARLSAGSVGSLRKRLRFGGRKASSMLLVLMLFFALTTVSVAWMTMDTTGKVVFHSTTSMGYWAQTSGNYPTHRVTGNMIVGRGGVTGNVWVKGHVHTSGNLYVPGDKEIQFNGPAPVVLKRINGRELQIPHNFEALGQYRQTTPVGPEVHWGLYGRWQGVAPNPDPLEFVLSCQMDEKKIAFNYFQFTGATTSWANLCELTLFSDLIIAGAGHRIEVRLQSHQNHYRIQPEGLFVTGALNNGFLTQWPRPAWWTNFGTTLHGALTARFRIPSGNLFITEDLYVPTWAAQRSGLSLTYFERHATAPIIRFGIHSASMLIADGGFYQPILPQGGLHSWYQFYNDGDLIMKKWRYQYAVRTPTVSQTYPIIYHNWCPAPLANTGKTSFHSTSCVTNAEAYFGGQLYGNAHAVITDLGAPRRYSWQGVPFDVSSSTMVQHLNANYLQWYNVNSFSTPSHTHSIQQITGQYCLQKSKAYCCPPGFNTFGNPNACNANANSPGFGGVPYPNPYIRIWSWEGGSCGGTIFATSNSASAHLTDPGSIESYYSNRYLWYCCRDNGT